MITGDQSNPGDDEQEPAIVSEFTATYRLTAEDLAETPETDSDGLGRESIRTIARFTAVGQKWSTTNARIRKIHYDKGDEAGTIRLRVRRDNNRGAIIHETTIVTDRVTLVRDWGTAYVEFRALEVPRGGEAAIYIHVEWFT
jgi:hypothetical protein